MPPQFIANNGVNRNMLIQTIRDHLEDRNLPSQGSRNIITTRLTAAIVRENAIRDNNYHMAMEEVG